MRVDSLDAAHALLAARGAVYVKNMKVARDLDKGTQGGAMAASASDVHIHHTDKPDELGAIAAEDPFVADSTIVDAEDTLSTAFLVTMPESQTLEFKSSMRFDSSSGGPNKALEQVVVKSVSGLMNAQGGVLLIGIADDGSVIGIEKDVQALPLRQDLDYYENHLTTLLENGIGAAATANVRIRFEEIGGRTVCRVTVNPSVNPVWTTQKGQADVFFVRLNNSTRPFGARQAFIYISQRQRQR